MIRPALDLQFEQAIEPLDRVLAGVAPPAADVHERIARLQVGAGEREGRRGGEAERQSQAPERLTELASLRDRCPVRRVFSGWPRLERGKQRVDRALGAIREMDPKRAGRSGQARQVAP